MTNTALLNLSPLDPAYASIPAQRARLEHLLDYTRQHGPDPLVEGFLLNRLRECADQLDSKGQKS